MPSKLVDDVRALITTRRAEVPLSEVERALLIVTVSPPGRGGEDVVGELEGAIAAARDTIVLSRLDEDQRRALSRLLAASRAVLEYDPTVDERITPPPPAPDHRPRADIDL